MAKKGLHPEWHQEAKVVCNGEEVLTTSGTQGSYTGVWDVCVCGTCVWAALCCAAGVRVLPRLHRAPGCAGRAGAALCAAAPPPFCHNQVQEGSRCCGADGTAAAERAEELLRKQAHSCHAARRTRPCRSPTAPSAFSCLLAVDIWSGNHPYFQGNTSTVVTDEGRVNR